VTGEYYMGGHVGRVGVYSLTAREVSLTQAIISAGMLDQVAIPGRTQITRRLQGQDKAIIARVDLEKIFAGQEPDIYLKPDDQVLVGTNFFAPFLAAIRNGFRITYGFGFLYDRNYYTNNNNGSGF
jgi:polysaccharide biosynthesis/export protein